MKKTTVTETPIKCPVCQGNGGMNLVDYTSTVKPNYALKECPACKGKGILYSTITTTEETSGPEVPISSVWSLFSDQVALLRSRLLP